MLTCSVTSYYSHHRLSVGNSHSQQVGYLSHGLSATNRTHQSVEASGIGTLRKGIGHTATTRESASTAIGSGQQLAHLRNTGILIDSELLGGCKKHNSSYQGDSSKYNYCNQDEIHNLFVLVTIIISRYWRLSAAGCGSSSPTAPDSKVPTTLKPPTQQAPHRL